MLGTPTEHIWPGVESLRDYKKTFPKWGSQNLADMVPGLEPQGVDLLAVVQIFIALRMPYHKKYVIIFTHDCTENDEVRPPEAYQC